jgi:hypothetical protein
MKRQVVALYRHQTGSRTANDTVNLATVKALIERGLAQERHGNELRTNCRLPCAYPLTGCGRVTAMAVFQELYGGDRP